MSCVVNIKELVATKVILPQLVDILKSTLNREKLSADSYSYFQKNLEMWESLESTFSQIYNLQNPKPSEVTEYIQKIRENLKHNNDSLHTSIKTIYQHADTHNAMLKVCSQIECKLLNIVDMLISELECIEQKSDKEALAIFESLKTEPIYRNAQGATAFSNQKQVRELLMYLQ